MNLEGKCHPAGAALNEHIKCLHIVPPGVGTKTSVMFKELVDLLRKAYDSSLVLCCESLLMVLACRGVLKVRLSEMFRIVKMVKKDAVPSSSHREMVAM